MVIIKTLVLTFTSIIVLFNLAKLMGNKQISQLSTFDYINGITIGSIAAELSTEEWDNVLEPLTAMIIYGLVAVAISYISLTTMPLRRFFSGKTTVIFKNIGEFLTEVRAQGYFSIKDIECAYLESNGVVSVLPKSEKAPLTPYDMGMKPKKAEAEPILIMDGKILYKNLKQCGKDEQWLNEKVKEKGAVISDVFIAQADGENNLSVYVKTDESVTNDIFQ